MTIADALAALNKAGQTASKMDVELGAATERLGVRNLSSAQAHVSAAHKLLGEQGRNLAAVEKVLLSLQSEKPTSPIPVDPPAENIVEWARRVHPETDIGNGYQLAIIAGSRTNYEGVWTEYMARQGPAKPPQVPKPPATPPHAPPNDPVQLPPPQEGRMLVKCPIRFTRTEKSSRMTGLYMRGEEMAIEFTTPDYTSAVRGSCNSFEYVGAPQYKTGSISDKPFDLSFGPGKENLNGPQGTNYNYFSLGADHPKYIRLEPGRTYYYNLKSFGWTPETAEQQFAVEIYMPEPA